MKIMYGLARRRNRCYGHGDFRDELVIAKKDEPYGGGHFPRVFASRERAIEFMKSLGKYKAFEVVDVYVDDAL